MWVFYLISLPLTLGMVVFTLRYFAGPDVPGYVLFTVGYTWFCSLSIIILVPADIWTTMTDHSSFGISFFWSLSYWSTFFLTWGVVPTLKGYEDAGDFTMAERLKTSVGRNLAFFLCVGSVGLVGLVLLIIWHKHWNGSGGIHGLAMACSNTFGLVTGAFLLGFGLSEIPKTMWKSADWIACQKALSQQVAKMAVKFDDAYQELSNVIVVAQATSSQMSKRDPFRPFMNVIDNMLHKMLMEDPSFKPQGGTFGENDMDYDTDVKSMAMLRRRLRIAGEQYCRYRSEYIMSVLEALELEDTIKNHEFRDATGWKYISSFRPERTGKLGHFLDMIEFSWRCVLRKRLMKLFAIILGGMSAAILIAEATILPSGVHLSLFSILINSVGMREMLVQVAAFVPLMYMCICTYYSLFKIGMLMFYSFTPHQTSSVSLLTICSMVARYAPPISYNFLNLIHLPGDKRTVFEKRMGNIDDAVPFFGNDFNRIYPLIMVLYTLILATNFFDRVITYVGNWKIFKFKNRPDGTDGFNPSGLVILQRERYWLQQGHHIGEHLIPLSRNFNDMSINFKSSSHDTDKDETHIKVSNENVSKNGSQLKPLKEEPLHATSRDNVGKESSPMSPIEDDSTAVTIQEGNSKSTTTKSSSRFASKWNSMKTGLQGFKMNFGSQKFRPLSQGQGNKNSSNVPRTESLDDIFERLQRRSPNADEYEDDEDDFYDHASGSSKLQSSR